MLLILTARCMHHTEVESSLCCVWQTHSTSRMSGGGGRRQPIQFLAIISSLCQVAAGGTDMGCCWPSHLGGEQGRRLPELEAPGGRAGGRESRPASLSPRLAGAVEQDRQDTKSSYGGEGLCAFVLVLG